MANEFSSKSTPTIGQSGTPAFSAASGDLDHDQLKAVKIGHLAADVRYMLEGQSVNLVAGIGRAVD